jgi:signal transduction histidine kinase
MSLHGGTISVRSQYGVGTIISLRLPKRGAAQKQA